MGAVTAVPCEGMVAPELTACMGWRAGVGNALLGVLGQGPLALATPAELCHPGQVRTDREAGQCRRVAMTLLVCVPRCDHDQGCRNRTSE